MFKTLQGTTSDNSSKLKLFFIIINGTYTYCNLGNDLYAPNENNVKGCT